MASELTQLGEAFVGSGPEAAHLNTVLGVKGGPVEIAWAIALATPREGHAAFVVVAQPNIPVRPLTLFVNKAMITSPDHARLTWGPAQLGVASGVLDALSEGILDEIDLALVVLIAAVWVDPLARDEDAVYVNNREATRVALARGRDDLATGVDVAALLGVRDTPINGYYVPATLRGGPPTN